MVGNDTNRAHPYDLHGKLTRHRALSGLYQGITLLDENLYYASGPGTPCYNGSISAMTDCLLSPATDQNYSGYTYSYDGMNRLLTATSRGGMSLNSAPQTDLTERMEYNVDSSLKTLIRRGKFYAGDRTIDSLTISHSNGRVSRIVEKAPTNLLTGTFEIVQNGRHNYYYDNAGSLTRDMLRNITIHNDINGNPDFMTFGGGSEIECGYTTGGQKLWTVHRTPAGFIPSNVLSDPNKPKPTPEIGNTPSQYSQLSDYLIQSVDVTRYYDGYEFYDRNLTEGKFYFSNGYVSFHSDGSFDYSAIITDYRGSTRVVMTMDSTLSTSAIVQANSYYPSGALVTDVQTSFQLSSTSGGVQTHKFLGKELDRMYGLDWYDLGARRYDAAAETFWTMDPLCEKYYHINPYAYCAGDPVNFIDPNGLEVKAVFNRETHKLYIIDLDCYNKALPTVRVPAKDYQLGGIRDKDGNLTHNQELVINNVFSGGQVVNGKIVRDADDRRQLAIPNAKYDIVDNNEDTRHSGWFRLDRQDTRRYNDKDDVSGRDGYRFHLGGLSWGCVTIDKTQDSAQSIWEVVSSILNSTSTTTVAEKRGKQWLNPFSRLTKYGILEVKGADIIPFKLKEE